MLKIILTVKDNKDKKSCDVVIKNPTQKEIDNASQEEKNACANVLNHVKLALENLQKQN